MERREKRRGPRKVALGLSDSRFLHEGIHVVRYDTENLIKLSQRLGETTNKDIGNPVLEE